MDDNDRKLINLLQENARYSLKQLSEKVFLSSPAVAARISKLEHNGLILGYHASANYDRMGFHILAFINLVMQPKMKSDFTAFIQNVPNVLECHVVSGNYTMLMKAAFPSTTELDQFIAQVQRYGSTETHIVFSTPIQPRGIVLPMEEE